MSALTCFLAVRMALSARPLAWELYLSDCLIRTAWQIPSCSAFFLTAVMNENSAAPPHCGSNRECPSSPNHDTAEATRVDDPIPEPPEGEADFERAESDLPQKRKVIFIAIGGASGVGKTTLTNEVV